MIRVIDWYDGYEDSLGVVKTCEEAISLMEQRIEDTDGECDLQCQDIYGFDITDLVWLKKFKAD